MNPDRTVLSPDYRDAARVALALQLPLALVCILILDFGRTAKICGAAMLAFWIMAAALAARRPWSPTRSDLLFWRWGFPGCLAVALLAAEMVRGF